MFGRMTSLKFKLALLAVTIDLLLYGFLFYSGVILPGINPSVEQYNAQMTSFPRDAMQKILWIALHWPTSLLVHRSLGARFLGLSVIQTVLIFLGIGSWLDRKKENKFKDGEGTP